jgi:heme-degrading monooxygenase HmoA
MVEIVWEFVVKEEARGYFELAYGPGGAWSQLFARSPGFRGITVLRDIENPRRYLTVDLWDTAGHREQALAECGAEHHELEASLGEWIESRTEVGTFRILAESTVRPRGRTGRDRSGVGRRGSGRTTR